MTEGTARLRRTAGGAASALALGVLLWVLSEQVFWSAVRPGDDLAGALGGIAVYTVLGVLLSALVRTARARNVPVILLAGAAYGWLVEGVAATTLYGTAEVPFPATIAWTGLAWHMPVVVLGGWWLLGRALRRGVGPTVVLALAGGAGWGVWAAGWGPAAGSTLALAGFAVAIVLLAAAAHLVLAVAPASTGPVAPIVCGVLATGWFLAVVVPAVPWSPLVLLPLLAAAVGASALDRAPVLTPEPLPARPRPAAFVALVIVVPIAATLVRTVLLLLLPSGSPLQALVAGLLSAIGAVSFLVACARQVRRRSAPAPDGAR